MLHRACTGHPLDGNPRVDGGARLVRRLLAFAAANAGATDGRAPPPTAPEPGDRGELRWVIDGGLAPLLDRAVAEADFRVPDAWRRPLAIAALQARSRHTNLVDCALRVVDTCADLRVPVTLLKGISTSEQYYAFAHERAMGDIDVLVPKDRRPDVEAALAQRGFRIPPIEWEEDMYHGPPIRHDGLDAWVEVHASLFPGADPLSRNRLFGSAQIAQQTVASTFHGRPVLRLSDELQLVYIASYWMRDLTQHKAHPSFLSPIFDAVHLLRARGGTLDWDGLLDWLDNETAAASLYVLVSYVCDRGLDESAVRALPRLAARQHVVSPADVKAILDILDTRLLGGREPDRGLDFRHATLALRSLQARMTPGSSLRKRLQIPWNILFPPELAERYSLRFQRERIARILRAIGAGRAQAG